jgi:hypothetical protein
MKKRFKCLSQFNLAHPLLSPQRLPSEPPRDRLSFVRRAPAYPQDYLRTVIAIWQLVNFGFKARFFVLWGSHNYSPSAYVTIRKGTRFYCLPCNTAALINALQNHSQTRSDAFAISISRYLFICLDTSFTRRGAPRWKGPHPRATLKSCPHYAERPRSLLLIRSPSTHDGILILFSSGLCRDLDPRAKIFPAAIVIPEIVLVSWGTQRAAVRSFAVHVRYLANVDS